MTNDMHTSTKISYLGEVVASTGLRHRGGTRQIGGRFACVDDYGAPIKMRGVSPLTVEHEPLPVAVHCGWGDRVGGVGAPELPVWTDPDADGVAAQSGRTGEVRVTCRGYATDLRPGWVDVFARVVAVLRAAHAADIRDRSDVAEVCGEYAGIIAGIEAEYAAHARRWDADVLHIARKFRRARVVVGEQTVPGKCVVRSTRGNALGYAHVWDGRWLGTVKVCR